MRLLPLFLVLVACGADKGSTGGTGTTTGTDPGAGTVAGATGGTAAGSAASCDGITPEVIEITPAELNTMLASKDFELINVHIPNEGEIPGTDVHIAYTDTTALEAHLGNDVAAKAVLYCKTGPMSAIASAALVDQGYCRIYDMPAGMIGWEGAGYTIAD